MERRTSEGNFLRTQSDVLSLDTLVRKFLGKLKLESFIDLSWVGSFTMAFMDTKKTVYKTINTNKTRSIAHYSIEPNCRDVV